MQDLRGSSPLGNRQGPHVLACDYVGTKLALWFGLPTADCAILVVTSDDEIPLGGGRRAAPGAAFVSRWLPGNWWGGSRDELEGIENPEAIARLVAFDTWTLNCDRYPPDTSTRRPNRDNVLLCLSEAQAGERRLVAIDHTHCFTCGRDLTPSLANIAAVKDPRTYGLFPEFREWITMSGMQDAADRLRQVSREEVRALVDEIPDEWEVPGRTRCALVELICRRAAFVAGRLVDSLLPYYPCRQHDFRWD